jgi:hypothetical protein
LSRIILHGYQMMLAGRRMRASHNGQQNPLADRLGDRKVVLCKAKRTRHRTTTSTARLENHDRTAGIDLSAQDVTRATGKPVARARIVKTGFKPPAV